MHTKMPKILVNYSTDDPTTATQLDNKLAFAWAFVGNSVLGHKLIGHGQLGQRTPQSERPLGSVYWTNIST